MSIKVRHLAVQIASFVLDQLRANKTSNFLSQCQFSNVFFEIVQFPHPDHVTVKTRSHVRTLQQLGRQTELLAQPGMFLQTVLLVIAEEAKISTKRELFDSNLLFSGVESTSWFDFSEKFGVVLVGFFFQRDFSDAFLVVVVVENQRHILKDKIYKLV